VKDYRAAMLQSLVAVAWADEELHARELEVVEALIAAFDVAPDEAAQVREFAKTPRTLDDVPLHALSFDDRRVLVMHAVLLSYADGDPSRAELSLIDELLARLHIPQPEGATLLASAHEHARKLVPLRQHSGAELGA
jgi:uncharacterized tellurite resistance protein B-like protein